MFYLYSAINLTVFYSGETACERGKISTVKRETSPACSPKMRYIENFIHLNHI